MLVYSWSTGIRRLTVCLQIPLLQQYSTCIIPNKTWNGERRRLKKTHCVRRSRCMRLQVIVLLQPLCTSSEESFVRKCQCFELVTDVNNSLWSFVHGRYNDDDEGDDDVVIVVVVVCCPPCSRTDHWSVCPHVVRLDEETAACRWLQVDGRNSLRYDLPYTMYASAVNALGRTSSAPITIDTSHIGTTPAMSFVVDTTVIIRVIWLFV